jgi:hypothetical protein
VIAIQIIKWKFLNKINLSLSFLAFKELLRIISAQEVKMRELLSFPVDFAAKKQTKRVLFEPA